MSAMPLLPSSGRKSIRATSTDQPVGSSSTSTASKARAAGGHWRQSSLQHLAWRGDRQCPVRFHPATTALCELMEEVLTHFALRGLAKREARVHGSGLSGAVPMGELCAALGRQLHEAGARALFEVHCARGAAATPPAPELPTLRKRRHVLNCSPSKSHLSLSFHLWLTTSVFFAFAALRT